MPLNHISTIFYPPPLPWECRKAQRGCEQESGSGVVNAVAEGLEGVVVGSCGEIKGKAWAKWIGGGGVLSNPWIVS